MKNQFGVTGLKFKSHQTFGWHIAVKRDVFESKREAFKDMQIRSLKSTLQLVDPQI